jgi:hypothetical protein
MPNATEFPKQAPKPKRALSSVFKKKNFLLIKNPIIKIITPDPKKVITSS